MKPSFFSDKYPWGSVMNRTEPEIVALNIMTILKRTGDEFRILSFDEYRTERMKDGNYNYMEEQYFDQVIRYCKSSDTAELFSKEWRIEK